MRQDLFNEIFRNLLRKNYPEVRDTEKSGYVEYKRLSAVKINNIEGLLDY